MRTKKSTYAIILSFLTLTNFVTCAPPKNDTGNKLLLTILTDSVAQSRPCSKNGIITGSRNVDSTFCTDYLSCVYNYDQIVALSGSTSASPNSCAVQNTGKSLVGSCYYNNGQIDRTYKTGSVLNSDITAARSRCNSFFNGFNTTTAEFF